jgi:adenylate kinase family enzyme
MQKILIMGLPGAGKTTLANVLKNHLEDIKHEGYGLTVEWFNADEVRRTFNDWDFSET